MIRCDALVVGGGPAGSTCARALRLAGWDVIVADAARFPRDKVCAGWLTPEVFTALELDPGEYRDSGLTLQEITSFRTGIIGRRLIDTTYPRVVSYGIRRCEFDDFLLRRANVRVLEATPIDTLRRTRTSWIANDAIEATVLVGAGGHFCPVAKHLRGGADTARPVVAKEAEFLREAHAADAAGDAPSLFFCRDLDGYGWCVPKGRYLNVGIGRRGSRDFAAHVRDFIVFLEERRVIRSGAALRWRGHAYLAAGVGPRPLIGPGVALVGDAAGLAYPESGEGIRPSIESGRLAAEAIVAAAGRDDITALEPYAEALRAKHPPVPRNSAPVRAVTGALGRLLMGSPAFTKHVVLDRWFLRA
ncbi:MAG: NAD(P)/FAD-dependent oxidoreductase [Vicinamibacterales bacterium]|jgi:flavin-dependent dehydrogenase